MAERPETTPDYQRGVEDAASACDTRAASYRAKLAEFEGRGVSSAMCDVLRAKAETAESIARSVRELATHG